eukprot:PLAT11901.1.p1 GENE.PLAT11901.1~~PLAT11901.1.p1  ORF type:complete len:414 (+),score=179.61 PLAT11901.1:32-1243(+)
MADEEDVFLLAVDGRTYRQTAVTMRRVAERRPRRARAGGADARRGAAGERGGAAGAGGGAAALEAGDIICTGSAYVSTLFVPSACVGYVIGRGGATVKRLNDFHDVSIQVDSGRRGKGGRGRRAAKLQKLPRTGPAVEAPAKVTIKGDSPDAVSSARTELLTIAASARARLPFTHFLSLPLRAAAGPAAALQAELAADVGGEFVLPAERLHITLLMLKLLTEEEVAAAAAALAATAADVAALLAGERLSLRLEGLDCFGDDASQATSIHMRIADDGGRDRIVALQQLLFDALRDTDVLPSADVEQQAMIGDDGASTFRPHVTLLNARYAASEGDKRGGRGGRGKRGGRGGRGGRDAPSFDAAAVLEERRAASFGTVLVPTVELSQRGRFDDDGYYAMAAKLEL